MVIKRSSYLVYTSLADWRWVQVWASSFQMVSASSRRDRDVQSLVLYWIDGQIRQMIAYEPSPTLARSPFITCHVASPTVQTCMVDFSSFRRLFFLYSIVVSLGSWGSVSSAGALFMHRTARRRVGRRRGHWGCRGRWLCLSCISKSGCRCHRRGWVWRVK